jgi:hypothetical protein
LWDLDKATEIILAASQVGAWPIAVRQMDAEFRLETAWVDAEKENRLGFVWGTILKNSLDTRVSAWLFARDCDALRAEPLASTSLLSPEEQHKLRESQKDASKSEFQIRSSNGIITMTYG